MATLDESFYDPVPGYTQTRRRRTETPPPADVPRGGMPVPGSDPLAGVQERDIIPETFADPLSPTRSMRYGPGDQRDLSVPTPPPPVGWRPPMPSELPPARPDPTAPTPLFSGVAGEDFEATRRRGEQVAKLMRETDGPFANPNDWNYVRSYGPRAAAQAVASGRANISGADPALVAQERERYLRNRTTDLSISPQLRAEARDELAQIERDAAEERRREMWAEEQAARLEGARIAASAPVSFGAGTGVVPDGNGGWTPVQPPAPERPRNVQRRGDGALVDGDTGEVISEMPAPPADPNAGPWVPGGGATSVNRVTGDIKTAPGASQNPPVQTGRYTYKEGRIVDTATGEYQELPPRDRKIVVQEMIDQLRREAAKAGDYQAGSYATQIAALEAELRALSGEPDPTPAEAAEVKKKGWWGGLFGGSDEPAPATEAPPAAGWASSPSEPPPAPAPAPAPEPKPAPKGYKRLPNGELEYVG